MILVPRIRQLMSSFAGSGVRGWAEGIYITCDGSDSPLYRSSVSSTYAHSSLWLTDIMLAKNFAILTGIADPCGTGAEDSSSATGVERMEYCGLLAGEVPRRILALARGFFSVAAVVVTGGIGWACGRLLQFVAF